MVVVLLEAPTIVKSSVSEFVTTALLLLLSTFVSQSLVSFNMHRQIFKSTACILHSCIERGHTCTAGQLQVRMASVNW